VGTKSAKTREARENCAEFELRLYSSAEDYGKFFPLVAAEEMIAVKLSE